MPLSVLARARRADVVREPFPHVVIQPALDPELYAELARSFPPAELFLAGREAEGNRYYQYRAAKIVQNPNIAEAWREFVRYHTSAEFFGEVIELFGLDELRETATSVRFAEPMAAAALDCQFFYCTPPTVPATTSRAPHIDREVAVFGGLLYFRLDGDESTGGDLELFRLKGEAREYGHNRAVPRELLEHVKTIRYSPNTFVLFLNTPESIHGVSPRSMTPYPRLHVNFVAELAVKRFDISPWSAQEVTA